MSLLILLRNDDWSLFGVTLQSLHLKKNIPSVISFGANWRKLQVAMMAGYQCLNVTSQVLVEEGEKWFGMEGLGQKRLEAYISYIFHE